MRPSFFWQGSCSFAGCEELVPVGGRVDNDASVIANGLTKRLHARAGRELGEELGGLQASRRDRGLFQASGEPWELRLDADFTRGRGIGLERASGCKTLAKAQGALPPPLVAAIACATLQASDLSSQKPALWSGSRKKPPRHATASFQSSPAVAVCYRRARCRGIAQRCHDGPPPPRPLAEQKQRPE